jgi:hypothetical protein
MAEAVAASTIALVVVGEVEQIEAMPGLIVKRNPEMLSAGLRRDDGTLLNTVGDHAKHWTLTAQEPSTDTQLKVPIRAGAARWGQVESARFDGSAWRSS